MLRLHEDAFYAFFRPFRHPDASHNIWGGLGLETFGDDYALACQFDIDHVWTVVDSGVGCEQWITPGIRYVNRVCYLLAERPSQGLDVDFRCPHRPSTLTSLGLRRQTNQLERALMEKAKSV